jgi:hypothetical protein
MWLRAGWAALAVFVAALLAIVAVDGIERWQAQHRQTGTTGVMTLDQRLPPRLGSWTGTYTSDDGGVIRTVHLGEAWPQGGHGDRVRVLWRRDRPSVVYLASGSHAFTHWAQAMATLSAVTVLLVSAVLYRNRRARPGAGLLPAEDRA